jgi:membrane-associated phospholipid phosphatase
MNKKNIPYGFYLYLLFLLAGLSGGFFFEKGEAELLLNSYHHPCADFFFRYWTYLGDGFVFVILIAWLFFKRYYYVILTVMVVFLQTLMVQGMKRWIFPDVVRPKLYFQDIGTIHFVEGVQVFSRFSFPSGHTAAAFSVATLLSLFIKNKWLSVIWFLMAFLVGISRVYLMQHFFIDIVAGSVIGVISGWLVYYLFRNSTLAKSDRLNQSLKFTLFR